MARYGGGFELIISRSVDLRDGEIVATLDVSGKREARKVAAEHTAKPWNF